MAAWCDPAQQRRGED